MTEPAAPQHIPSTFAYRTRAQAYTTAYNALTKSKTLQEKVAAIGRLTFDHWGLHPVGYHHTGFNGTDSDGWVLAEPYASHAILNIHKPGNRYIGRMTVLIDEDSSNATTWVDVTTGHTSVNPRDVIGRWVYSSLPSGAPTPDLGEIRSTHIPGSTVWTVAFTSKQEFLDALRQAHALMRDIDQIAVHAALMGIRLEVAL